MPLVCAVICQFTWFFGAVLVLYCVGAQIQGVLNVTPVLHRTGAGPDDEIADVNRGDESGYSPLYNAANEGYVRVGAQ